jgi:hypothetical protein
MADKKKPECFGKVDIVFPMTDNGYRETPENCMENCEHRVDCLRWALSSDPESDRIREEQVDRAYDAGLMSFLERWSRKKTLNKNKKKK